MYGKLSQVLYFGYWHSLRLSKALKKVIWCPKCDTRKAFLDNEQEEPIKILHVLEQVEINISTQRLIASRLNMCWKPQRLMTDLFVYITFAGT